MRVFTPQAPAYVFLRVDSLPLSLPGTRAERLMQNGAFPAARDDADVLLNDLVFVHPLPLGGYHQGIHDGARPMGADDLAGGRQIGWQ